jgi:hypothetical protein
MNSHGPVNLLLITPPADPASSPADVEYFAPLVIGMLPSVVTAEGPPLVSLDLPMFG